jgi:hypothetical protein
MFQNQDEPMPCQALYAWAERLDNDDLGGLPECAEGASVYEVNIGTRDAAYGGWYFPIRYYIDIDTPDMEEETREEIWEWERKCLADTGTTSSHGPIPDSAAIVETHKDVLDFFAECCDVTEGSEKPSVRMMVEVDWTWRDSWGDSAISAITKKESE